MKAKLKNLLTGDIIDVHSTTDSVDSSYGLECWVDKKGNSYGQCQFGAPLGFELVECDTPIDQFVNPGCIKDYFSKLGKKGGSSRTPKKSASSAANLDKARAEGKKGGWKKGTPRRHGVDWLVNHGYELFASDNDTSLWQKQWGRGWRVLTLDENTGKIYDGRALGWEDADNC